jgi:hypothetical protein
LAFALSREDIKKIAEFNSELENYEKIRRTLRHENPKNYPSHSEHLAYNRNRCQPMFLRKGWQ